MESSLTTTSCTISCAISCINGELMKTQFLNTDAAFALRVKQLQDKLYDQMETAMAQFGLKIPSKTSGIVQLLFSEGPRSKADIARELDYSHQLAAQRLSWLLKHGMVEMQADAADKRRQFAVLTQAGRHEAETLQRFLPKLSDAYASLFAEMNLDLNAVIERANSALISIPITERSDFAEPQHAVTSDADA